MRLALKRGAYFHIIGFALFKDVCLAQAPCTFLEVGALGPFVESLQRDFAFRFGAMQECRMAMGSLTSGEAEERVKRKVVRSSPLLQTAARRRVVCASSGVGRTLSPRARLHI